MWPGDAERNRIVQVIEYETKKPRKKSLRLLEPFHLSLIVCLPQLTLKSYFVERLFSALDNGEKS